MKQNKNQSKKLTIIFLTVISIVFIFSFVSSAQWPLGKQTTCNLFNMSGEQCDSYWCTQVIECNYNISLSACICNKIENYTVVVNNTVLINNTLNASDLNITYVNNYSKSEIIDQVINNTKNYTDLQVRNLRDSLLDRIDNKTFVSVNGEQSQGSDWPWYTIPITVMILVIGLGYLAFTQQQKSKFSPPNQYRRNFKYPNDLNQSDTNQNINNQNEVNK